MPTPINLSVPTIANAPRRRSATSNHWGMIAAFGTIAALYFARDILIPLAFALILTFVLSPVVALLQRTHIGRGPSVGLTMLATILATGWVSWVIVIQLVDVAQEIPQYRQNILAKMEVLRIPTKGPFGLAAASLREIAAQLSSPVDPGPVVQGRRPRSAPGAPPSPAPVVIVQPKATSLDYVRDVAEPLLHPLLATGLVLIFTVFMLIRRLDLIHRLFSLVGLGHINVMTQALDDAALRVSRYLLMQVLVNAGFGVLFGLGLYFIGVPNAILWGVLAGLLRIVPYVGTLVAASLPMALSLASSNGWLPPLLVAALFLGLELSIGNFVEPLLYGAHTGISSLALMVAAVFWSVLWGPAGLILSTPLTVCAVVLGRYIPELSFLHIMLGDEVVLGEEVQIYQRLLAMDQSEAHAIVERFLKDKTLVQLYDSVIIPALSLAEEDRHKGQIDTAREEFLYSSINEMISEFSENQAVAAPVDLRVLCVPANDRADEVTAAMLAQLLEQTGCTAVAVSVALSSRAELLARLAAGQDDLVCISALPPYTFAPARTMCKLIREKFPKLKVVVGVWGFAGDTEKAKARFERAQPDRLVTSMASAIEQIQELHSPAELLPQEARM
ncbi:MAG: AI-2E family transporter [Bryobacteraceae bacterium]